MKLRRFGAFLVALVHGSARARVRGRIDLCFCEACGSLGSTNWFAGYGTMNPQLTVGSSAQIAGLQSQSYCTGGDVGSNFLTGWEMLAGYANSTGKLAYSQAGWLQYSIASNACHFAEYNPDGNKGNFARNFRCDIPFTYGTKYIYSSLFDSACGCERNYVGLSEIQNTWPFNPVQIWHNTGNEWSSESPYNETNLGGSPGNYNIYQGLQYENVFDLQLHPQDANNLGGLIPLHQASCRSGVVYNTFLTRYWTTGSC